MSHDWQTVSEAPQSEPARAWTNVLLVEDDEDQVLALKIGLGREGFTVIAVVEGATAIAAAERLRPDVVLLDVGLPGRSGIEICRELRARGSTVPIIIVSSRGDETDVVRGIEVGADDYVTKPYRLRELVARITALQRRRARGTPGRDAEQAPGALRAGEVFLDRDRHEVRVEGRPVELTRREFQILHELLVNAGRVVTHEQLLDRVWGSEFDGDPRVVSTLVRRLRAQLAAAGARANRITTIRGVGYRFNDREKRGGASYT